MRRLLLALLLLLPASLRAEPAIVSAAPERVAVTLYRAPYRPPGVRIDPEQENLGGYALVTETRTVELPAGPVTIRFEGVASGIQPETAILTGAQAREKNQDRQLLSKQALIDAFTGQQVILRRTDSATGKVTQSRVRIRSAANGVVVETPDGFESLNCTGLNETILYPNVPAGVSAKPVLSMALGDQPGGRRTVTLSYLTGNFDWQANYVADLSADGTRVDLFAWLTLASRDDTSFVDAATNAIAGRVSRADGEAGIPQPERPPYRVIAQCWPQTVVRESLQRLPQVLVLGAEEFDGESIVVTGSRIARQEQLGDLKLYRIPMPVTVAARSQKQVAFLSRRGVRAELLYRSDLRNGGDGSEPRLMLRILNRKEQGLGEPLPAGQATLFQRAAGQRLLLGESSTDDKAVGETVELAFGDASNIKVENEEVDSDDNWERHRLTVFNANPFPVLYEARFTDTVELRYEGFSRRLEKRDGRRVWRLTLAPNATATLLYREVETEG